MTEGPGNAEPPAGSRQGDPADLPAFLSQDGPSASGSPSAPGYQPPGSSAPGYGGSPYGAPQYGAPPYGEPPPTHLVWARIATIAGVLFSLILGFPSGLMAINQGRKVRRYWEAGDHPAAVRASRKARTWAIIATVLDALGLIFLIVLIGTASSSSNFSNPAVVAASIKTQLQKRISDPSSQFYSPGLKVVSVVCTRVTATTDHCVDRFSNGQTASETAVISSNGERYVTR